MTSNPEGVENDTYRQVSNLFKEDSADVADKVIAILNKARKQ
jgi:hypothetical protein